MVSVKIEPPETPEPRAHRCRRCGASGIDLATYITKTSNRNENAGRPYLKCDPCKQFVSFLDDRGIHDVNPKCACKKRSRIRVSGKHKGRTFHYVCSSGECDFYDEPEGEHGRIRVTDEQMLKMMAGLSLI